MVNNEVITDKIEMDNDEIMDNEEILEFLLEEFEFHDCALSNEHIQYLIDNKLIDIVKEYNDLDKYMFTYLVDNLHYDIDTAMKYVFKHYVFISENDIEELALLELESLNIHYDKLPEYIKKGMVLVRIGEEFVLASDNYHFCEYGILFVK